MEIGYKWYGRVLSLFVGHLLLALGAIGEGADISWWECPCWFVTVCGDCGVMLPHSQERAVRLCSIVECSPLDM